MLSKKKQYALMVISYLVNKPSNEPISISEIAATKKKSTEIFRSDIAAIEKGRITL